MTQASDLPIEILTFGLARGGRGLVELGSYGYSWDLAMGAFLPVLSRIAPVRVLTRPESQLDYWVREARERGRQPVVLAFRPFQDAFLIRGVPILSYCFWEFPDVPTETFQDNPRYDWRRMAGEVAMILCGSSASAAAFRRAGVTTPIHVVQPPLPPRWFDPPRRATSTPLPAIELVRPAAPEAPGPRFDPFGHMRPPLWRRGLRFFKRKLVTAGRLLAPPLAWSLALRARERLRRPVVSRPDPITPADRQPLPHGHVVFTFIFNPRDERKAWQEVLTSFVLALGDREDATLVLKFTCSSRDAPACVAMARQRYDMVAHLRPRCRVFVIDQRLSDEGMDQLVAETTWYINGTRAEGCCLPLLEMMAAGRPALSPVHTAMSDYFNEKTGLILDSDEVPTHWPGDHSGRLNTSWHHLSWPGLCRGLREAYRMARTSPGEYAALADGARQAARGWAAEAVVEARLRRALAAVCPSDSLPNRKVA